MCYLQSRITLRISRSSLTRAADVRAIWRPNDLPLQPTQPRCIQN
jgi:hypothetical protein